MNSGQYFLLFVGGSVIGLTTLGFLASLVPSKTDRDNRKWINENNRRR